MNQNLKRITMMLFTFALAFCILTIPASAATKKLKNQSFTTSAAKAKKKATALKRGTYTIKLASKGKGFAKFKAPKTKTYAFTISNLKSKKSYACGYFYVMTTSSYSNSYITMSKLKTKGGTTTGMYFATKSGTSGAMKSRFLKTRTGKIKLKKNQTVYLYYYCTAGNSSFKFRIK